jgi:hypothetical protein
VSAKDLGNEARVVIHRRLPNVKTYSLSAEIIEWRRIAERFIGQKQCDTGLNGNTQMHANNQDNIGSKSVDLIMVETRTNCVGSLT